MKFVKLSVFALLLLSVACTNDLNDSDSLVNQQEYLICDVYIMHY